MMRVRSVDVSASDIASSSVFFDALTKMWDLTKGEVLDAFARDGTITVNQYRHKVGAVDCWELMNQHASTLAHLEPRDIKFACSYFLASQTKRKYDMVVVDTPQGLHDDHKGEVHVEHFDFLRLVPKLLKDVGIIVLYVNKSPYDKAKAGSHGYDEYDSYDYSKWLAARSIFYQCDPLRLTEEAAVKAYREHLGTAGFMVKKTLLVPCFSDVVGLEPYAFRLAIECERTQ